MCWLLLYHITEVASSETCCGFILWKMALSLISYYAQFLAEGKEPCSFPPLTQRTTNDWLVFSDKVVLNYITSTSFLGLFL